MLKTAVIGVGNMGSKYASILQDKLIDGMELAALTRVKGSYRELLQKSIDSGVPVYDCADALFEAMENGYLHIDAIIIATPHYSHEELAKCAKKFGDLNIKNQW